MNVVIAGLGLIGGSLGMALKRRGWHVSYVDPAVSEVEAKNANAADEKLDDARGEIVVIATPLDVAKKLRTDASLVTTTCSVMRPFTGANVVAGHPFAGSEKRGLGAARADLFEGKPWFVSRDEPRVRAIIEAAGARQVLIDPAEHDEALALTSHLPQALSTALAALIEKKKIDPIFLGSGVRTFLRLAGSSHGVWGSVLAENAEAIARARAELLDLAATLGEEEFRRAQQLMKEVSGEPPER